jgi:SAM-dependent MidA family methyltransferase
VLFCFAGDSELVPLEAEEVVTLPELIRDLILAEGPISFERFMELALYHPSLGYYRSGIERFGSTGDFFTAVQLQPTFGAILRAFVSTIRRGTAPEGEFAVLDLGAGRADLQNIAPSLPGYRPFDYGTDPMPERWKGLIFANEFFDALPVHVLQKTGTDDWSELYVQWKDSEFSFTTLPLELPKDLADYSRVYGEFLPQGSFLEVNLHAIRWIQRLRDVLECGYLLIIDYGYSQRELVRFPEGTLMSYRKHQASASVLSDPGSRDITSHVNFSCLREVALQAGFQIRKDCSLAAWIVGLAEDSELTHFLGTADQKVRGQWKQLLVGMGETFRVLLLER